MNNKILKLHKIDERYILSERKFLYTFGYLCLEEELIKNKNMSKKQLYYFLEQKLVPASELEVTLENVATGKIILVGRGNNFRAYCRPQENEFINTADVSSNLDEKSINYVKKLSTLIDKYYDYEYEDCSLEYFEEIISCAKLDNHSYGKEIPKKFKNKVKCYKKFN